MTSHLQVKYQQIYSLFAMNNLFHSIDCDVINYIKQLLVLKRRKIITTPIYEDIKHKLNNANITRIIDHDGAKWCLAQGPSCDTGLDIIYSLNNSVIQTINVYWNNCSMTGYRFCGMKTGDFYNYEVSIDQQIIARNYETRGDYMCKTYRHALIMVEKQ